MFLWRKRADAPWLAANEEELCEIAGARLAIVQKWNCETAIVEIAGANPGELQTIRTRFGGRIEKLPRDWLSRWENRKTKPIEIGHRLTIHRSARSGTKSLVIPASVAFGTGEHATTAMCLRFLEAITRRMVTGWGMLDLGTGSGILALAAKRFGAVRVVAIDSDQVAISVAKKNARLNRIGGIEFFVRDARKISGAAKFDIVAANLYSDLLIDMLPKLRSALWLILSGILREQEKPVLRALRRNGIKMSACRRRGKWIALLCRAGA
jgi:ribosomal protein L11 methyltransferase